MSASSDPRTRWFFNRRFALRAKEAPELHRASGDSGFVAHLALSTHGATGWDWSFRLVRPGSGWAFVTDGRLTLFLDEPGQYVPQDAKANDVVAVRLPRARENLFPHRFTLYGGQGGATLSPRFVKYFLPISFEGAGPLVDFMSGRAGDSLRFALHVVNSPLDFERLDTAVLDVGLSDEANVLKAVETFLKGHPEALKASQGLPYGTAGGPQGLARAEATGRADLGDGFGWRVSAEAAAQGKG